MSPRQGIGRAMTEPLISAQNLAKHFDVGGGGLFLRGKTSKLRAVDDVAISIMPGETLGLVGESGCGKSTLGRLLIRLLEPTAGTIRFQGQEITGLGRAAMREFRRSMQIIFQDPYGALNPRMAVEDIIAEPLVIHGAKSGAETRQKVTEMLDRVGLPSRALDRFPHEDMRLTYLFIAHDLSVVRHISDRVAVMYLGKIVEVAEKHAIYATPQHPYTRALIAAVPAPHPSRRSRGKRENIVGDIPSALNPPSGCRFHTRCPHVMPICREAAPPLVETQPGHQVACHLMTQA